MREGVREKADNWARDGSGSMVTRLNATLAVGRDALVSFFSAIALALSLGQLVHGGEGVALIVLDGASVAFLVLSAVDVVLLAKKVRWRGFYYGNAIYQLLPSFILTGLVGPLVTFGIVVFILNVGVLVTLREKKAEGVAPPATR